MLSLEQKTLFELVNQAALEAGVKVYVVGGVVRDLLLGARALDEDIDLMIGGDACRFAEKFNASLQGQLTIFERYFTAKIKAPRRLPEIHEVDFASARSETYAMPGALPVVALAAVSEDLRRRDFSINAMALEVSGLLLAASSADPLSVLSGAILDPFGGQSDLSGKILRVLHRNSFLDDPTRIFRAARYSARLKAEIEASSMLWLQEAVGQKVLAGIRAQRVGTELKKIAAEDRWYLALQKLIEWRALDSCGYFGSIDVAHLERAEQFISTNKDSSPEQRFAFISLLLRGESTFENWKNCWIALGMPKSRLTRLQAVFDDQAAHGMAERGDFSAYFSAVCGLS
ncbi:MAG: hypothetical protein K1X79_05090 [Oligoflexia bacterium]|nr:hypothetical protein [Oligoflexia bacterium]